MGEDMYNLLAKHFSGQANEEENATVQQWITASTANEADYKLLQKLWHVSAEQEPIAFDTEKALKQVASQIDAANHQPGKIRIFTLQRAVAVAAMLVISIAIWLIAGNSNHLKRVQAVAAIEAVTLSDGSKVWLRQGAILQYPDQFKGRQRNIQLTGEAFFDIAHDTTKPFIIAARQTAIRVVGTSFSVIAGNDSVEVIVKTGKVAFSATSNKKMVTLVAAGERALYSQEAITRQPNTDDNFDAWLSKQLVFKHTPMAHVIATLSKHYNATIDCHTIDVTELANTHVTVTFNNQTLASVLQELSLITPYEATQNGNNHFELRKK